MTCSMVDCGKPSHKKGWCNMHYTRWMRYGNARTLKGTSKGAIGSWLKANVPSATNECVVWPFSRVNGRYGKIAIGGKATLAHRVVCEMVHGPAPAEGMVAAHSCGKGHEGCVNSRHLRWATYSENNKETFTHKMERRARSWRPE